MVNLEKQGQAFDFGEWGVLSDYGREHPFNNDVCGGEDIETVGENESLEAIRQKHIDYLEGKYEPTPEESAYFDEDKEFYETELYKRYYYEKVSEFAEFHYEIYNPVDEEILVATQLCMDSVREDINGLYEIGLQIEKNPKSGLENAVAFFAEKFNVKNIPVLNIADSNCGFAGSYDHEKNVINLNIKGRSVGSQINTIAHEIWHARQYNCGDVRYKDNFLYYFDPSVDYDRYYGQLVEREAFMVGDGAEKVYTQFFAKEEIEKWNDKFDGWAHGEYQPDTNDDDLWRRMAAARMIKTKGNLEGFDKMDPMEFLLNERDVAIFGSIEKMEEAMDYVYDRYGNAKEPKDKRRGFWGRFLNKERK